LVWSFVRRERLVHGGEVFGAGFHVTVEDVPRREHGVVMGEIDRVLAEVDEAMSTWRDDSELARLNAAPEDEPFVVSEGLLRVLELCADVHARSNGALDPSVMPLVDAWGFGRTPALEPPDEAELAAARARVGFDRLELGEGRVTKHADLEIDLSAVAPGFAADEIAAMLRARGLERYMVEIGGEVVVGGNKVSGEPWRIGIEQPANDANSQATLHGAVELVDGMALATSGNYRNYREVDELRLSHVIDPATGSPITHALASVTVVHPKGCAAADAWATALLVLGPDRGLEVAEREGLAAYLIVREGEGFVTRRTGVMPTVVRP
jgi:thiamine biosynthesis lipoprotein